jgi:hypothetical protein
MWVLANFIEKEKKNVGCNKITKIKPQFVVLHVQINWQKKKKLEGHFKIWLVDWFHLKENKVKNFPLFCSN